MPSRSASVVIMKKQKSAVMTTAQLSKTIKSKINQFQETKMASRDLGFVNYNNQASVQGDVITLLPGVLAGIEEDQRVGTDIRCQSFYLKGLINVNPIHLDKPRARILMRMMVVQPIAYKNVVAAAAQFQQWLPNLLKQGSQPTGLDGSIKSMYLPINTDVITCYWDKRIEMISDFYEDAQSGNFAIHFASKQFGFKLNVKNKILRFDTRSQPEPNNFAPILLVSYCFMDGSAPVFTTTAVSMQAITVLKYKDA